MSAQLLVCNVDENIASDLMLRPLTNNLKKYEVKIMLFVLVSTWAT